MSDTATPVTGGCHCGHVRFEAEAYLDGAHYCHCSICRRFGGGPFTIGVPLRVNTLRFTAAEPTYVTSSEWAERGYCPKCGSQVLYRLADPAESWGTNVSLGALDQPENVTPDAHIFVESMLPWVNPQDGLPQITGDELLASVEEYRAKMLADAKPS